MRSKALKYTLIGLAAVVGLLVIAAVVVAVTFNPNDYKPLLIERVQQDRQRTLAIPGDIHLSFFPSLGVQLGAVSLSEHGNAAVFASVQSLRVSLAVLPLLHRQVVVDRIKVAGLHANITRFKDGRTSIDDLFEPAKTKGEAPAAAPAPGQAPLQFDIAGISITDAAVTVDDQQNGRRLELTKASIETGHIAPGVASDASVKGHVKAGAPQLDADLSLKAKLMLDPAQARYAISELQADISARLAGGALEASLSLPQLDVDAKTIVAPKITAKLSLQRPGGTLALNASGDAKLSLERHTLEARLAGKLDDSSFDAKIGMSRFSPAAYTFDINIDHIDADRYRSKAGAPAQSGGAAAPEVPLDLSALRELNASGSLRVGALQVAGIKASQLRADLRAAGGKLDLSPLSAELYQGRVAGSLALTASSPPRLAAQQTLTDINIGALLKDALGKSSLDGRGKVVLDVTAQGATVSALEKALAGSARVELRDGAVRGFNIAQALRKAKAKLSGAAADQTGTGSQSESTDFSEMMASFNIAHGVAHNDDLLAKSPLLRVTGNGDVDLGASRLDYVVKATVVDTLQGQGGPELQALRGQTLPVHLSGPFNAIGYKVDFASLAKDLAKDKVQSQGKEAEAKLKQRLGDKLKGLLGK